MPLYEYECAECGHVWEDMQSMADREKPLSEPCPACQARGTVSQKVGAKIGDPFALGVSGPSSSFKDIMRHHAKTQPKNKLGEWK